MEKKLDLREMYQLMTNYFGNKASRQYLSSEKQEITVILYGSFVFKFGIDDRYELFKGGIFIDDKHCVTNFFGQNLSCENNKSAIIKNFEIINNYCRLRLPDKFLREYDETNEMRTL